MHQKDIACWKLAFSGIDLQVGIRLGISFIQVQPFGHLNRADTIGCDLEFEYAGVSVTYGS